MLIDTLKGIKRIAQQNKHKETLTDEPYSFVNWWAEDPREDWFDRFLRSRFPGNEKAVRFYSVFGPKIRFYYPYRGKRVFYSGENIEPHVEHDGLHLRTSVLTYWKYRTDQYGDYNTRQANLALGMGYREKDYPNYLRFPEWIPFTFEPESRYEDVVRRVQEINESRPLETAQNAVLIASHDDYGTRERICRDVEPVMPITYGGKWRRNSEDLQEKFGDDKIRFLREFRFNICPENVDAPGYCTEKVFDSFRAGTIPIYHGAENDPEPGVINREAVILWNYDGGNEENVRRIRELNEHEDCWQDFLSQKKLKDTAADYVWDRIEALEARLRELINE